MSKVRVLKLGLKLDKISGKVLETRYALKALGKAMSAIRFAETNRCSLSQATIFRNLAALTQELSTEVQEKCENLWQEVHDGLENPALEEEE